MSLSSSLPRKGNRLIGLYEEGKSGGLSGLGIRTMFGNFHRSGKYESRKIALNKYVRNSIAFLGRHLATLR